jgi:DNA polymerase-3 subunit delta'
MILGQEKPYKSLMADLNNDRLAHSYLFYGPSGIGKKMAAKEFFKQVNGHERACTCRFCAQIDSESHPDLLIVSPDGKFVKIDQTRKIQHFLALMPIDSVVKMAIIDDCHDLKIEAANALLKTLEEPPEKSILVLVTSIPERLILTIKSRCRQVRFNPILRDDIAYYLTNNLKIEEKKANLTAAISGGIFGKALQVGSDNVFWVNRDSMIELALNLPDMEPEEALSTAKNLVETTKRQVKDHEKPRLPAGRDKNTKTNELVIKKLCDNLSTVQSIFRDALVFNETSDKSCIINSDWTDSIENKLSKIDSFRLVGYIENIERAKRMLSQNVNALLLLQSLFLNMD